MKSTIMQINFYELVFNIIKISQHPNEDHKLQ